ncbi:MAG: Uma2 family endonuclease [bacterium]
MSVRLLKRRFTVEEYERMGQAGILSEDDRVELIDGEIIEMAPIGSRHAAVVSRLDDLLRPQGQPEVIVRVQNPLHADPHSEPQPDLMLVKRRDDYYTSAHPRGPDVLLVIEVADTTLEYDRRMKVPLYARAGIPEAWIIALPTDQVEVFRQPSAGGYRSVSKVRRGEVLSVEALPTVTMAVDQVLGEAPQRADTSP